MLNLDLSGRVALVTGGSRGIGAACCRLLARAGADVAVHYHQAEEAAEELAGELKGYGVRSVALSADVSRPTEVEGLYEELVGTLGSPQIVVTSAGIWEPGAIKDLSLQDLRRMLAVNLEGTFHCCREAARVMEKRGGCMVLISSTAAQRGEAGHSPYAASKGGVQSLTKSLAVELAPRIRVNCVAPGWVRTDMTEQALEDRTRLRDILREIPLGRVAEPEDVAGAVVFLASERARQITGEILNVNGGSVLCG